MNFFFENLRNPAHNRRVGLMRQFSSGQLDSTGIYILNLVKMDSQKWCIHVAPF